MPHHLLPKKLLFGELKEGKRSRDAPKKHFKDSLNKLKVSLRTLTIDTDSWEVAAQDRVAVRKGARRCEASRSHAAQQCRQTRKDSAKSSAAATISCPLCPKRFHAKIGTSTPTFQIKPLSHEDEMMIIVATNGRTKKKAHLKIEGQRHCTLAINVYSI